MTWRHHKYLACVTLTSDDNNKESQEGFYPSKKLIIDSKLHAFSTYDLYIGATTLDNGYEVETIHTTFDTAPSAPDLDPNPGYTPQTDSYSQALRFHWKKTDCRRQNGIHEDYILQLEGLDPWAQDKIDHINETFGEFFFVDNLKPFS